MATLQRVILPVLAFSILPGCATITSSEIQHLALQTRAENGEPLEKAKCMLKNDKGGWEATSPGFVGVSRSAEDLLIECKKEGHKDGFLRAISRAAGGMFGNILFGGGIGAIIDHNKGTGYNYPDTLVVEMGKSAVIDRTEQNKAEQERASP